MSNPGKNNAKISNQPSGGGNKLQGLAPKATNFYMAPYTGQQYNTGTYAGLGRFKLVCMNQLGGIGSRYNSQFGPTADGLHCPPEYESFWANHHSHLFNLSKNWAPINIAIDDNGSRFAIAFVDTSNIDISGLVSGANFSAVTASITGNLSALVQVYELAGNDTNPTFTQVGQDISDQVFYTDPSGGPYFGWALSLNGTGDRLAISAPGGESTDNSGTVYIYDYSGNTELWEPSISIRPDLSNNFGYSMNLASDGEHLVVGSCPFIIPPSPPINCAGDCPFPYPTYPYPNVADIPEINNTYFYHLTGTGASTGIDVSQVIRDVDILVASTACISRDASYIAINYGISGELYDHTYTLKYNGVSYEGIAGWAGGDTSWRGNTPPSGYQIPASRGGYIPTINIYKEHVVVSIGAFDVNGCGGSICLGDKRCDNDNDTQYLGFYSWQSHYSQPASMFEPSLPGFFAGWKAQSTICMHYHTSTQNQSPAYNCQSNSEGHIISSYLVSQFIGKSGDYKGYDQIQAFKIEKKNDEGQLKLDKINFKHGDNQLTINGTVDISVGSTDISSVNISAYFKYINVVQCLFSGNGNALGQYIAHGGMDASGLFSPVLPLTLTGIAYKTNTSAMIGSTLGPSGKYVPAINIYKYYHNKLKLF